MNDLCDALATEVLGWHERHTMWWRLGSPTGLHRATGAAQIPQRGFFRPDMNLLHLQICLARLKDDGCEFSHGWSNMRYAYRIDFEDTRAELTVDVEELLSGETIEAAARVALAMWRELHG